MAPPGPSPKLRRMKRPIAALCPDEDLLTPGPSSVDELYGWAQESFDLLTKEFGDARANLETILWSRVDVSSHYSGKGTAESIMIQVHDTIHGATLTDGSVLGKDVGQLPENCLRCLFSCDQNPVCRKALLVMPCEHVFGNLEDRVRPDLQNQLSMMEPAAFMSAADRVSQYDDIKKVLFTASPPAFAPSHTAHCYRHGKQCPVWGDREGRAEAKSTRLSVSVTGFSCTDWSKRRTSALPGLSGKTTASFWKWKCEIKTMEPDVSVWENSTFFPQEILMEGLEDMCISATVVISPSLCGWPTNRLRQFGCLLKRDRIAWLGSAEEFCKLQRQCVLTGDVFFDLAPEGYIEEQKQFRAQGRGHYHIASPQLENMITQ